MPLVVAPNQCSFVPGRQSSDNIILAQEIVHSMKSMKKKKGFMALKIDLEKAYDRVRWDFVIACLQELGLPNNCVDLIYHCLSTAQMQVLWNGEAGPSFIPSRGVRQGDPLSPYLFVLVMEKLAHLIQSEVVAENWVPFSLKNNGTKISHLFFADDLMLFAEASLDQAAIIKACLDDFCDVSGEKVNGDKSRIYFSSNVCHNRRAEISSFLGFTTTVDLGKYLGIPIHHRRVSKSTYQFVLDKMDDRLKGWKINSLSMAARHTLVSSVVSAMPSYAMQSAWLPQATCDEIDKKCRGFLWGSTRGGRKNHLVAWEDVCKKKEAGGLGLRHARKQNEAFMMKLGWGLVKRRDALWVKFMREKYKCGNDVIPEIRSASGGSQAWKGIKHTWKNVNEGLGWRIGNGHRVKFWTDNWLPNQGKLIHVCTREVTDEMKEKPVSSYLSPSGGWCWPEFDTFLPNSILQGMSRMQMDLRLNEEDEPTWYVSPNGCFTVRSAYGLLNGHQFSQFSSNRGFWRKIWKLHVPQRCKSFLWLTARGRLMTNCMRFARGMGVTEDCSLCAGVKESIMHVLRDCPVALRCWNKVVPLSQRNVFFAVLDVRDWLSWNLNLKLNSMGVDWSIYFTILCRQLWLNRNSGLFNGKQADMLQILAQTSAQAKWSDVNIYNTHLDKGREIVWRAPLVGWVKFNVDGACRRDGSVAGSGGIARNSEGVALGGFMFNYGKGNCLQSEIWAVLLGLKYAWEAEWKNLVIESDCEEVLHLVSCGWNEEHWYADLLVEVRQILNRDWNVQLDWCSQDSNHVADFLAKESLSLPMGITRFRDPPEFLCDVLSSDVEFE